MYPIHVMKSGLGTSVKSYSLLILMIYYGFMSTASSKDFVLSLLPMQGFFPLYMLLLDVLNYINI